MADKNFKVKNGLSIGNSLNNTPVGYNSLSQNSSGTTNTAVGYETLNSNTSGSNNVAVGSYSLTSNTIGYDNVSVGINSLFWNTTGYYNTVLGNNTLLDNTTGSYNTAIGYNTLNKPQPESVIKSFTKRLNYDIYRPFKELFIKENNHIFTYTKCIIKTNYLLKLDIHEHKMLPEFNNYYNFITTYNNINNIHKNRAFSKINENIICSSILNLNHYCIQSLDFYSRVNLPLQVRSVYSLSFFWVKLYAHIPLLKCFGVL